MEVRQSHKFTSRERIKHLNEFLSVYRKGKRRVGKYYRIYVKSNGLSYPRLGLSVSKAVGKAVRRNYEKRIIREFFRSHRGTLPSWDIVIQRKPGYPPDFQLQIQELKRKLLNPHEKK
jgi:ribonuclease P protein component